MKQYDWVCNECKKCLKCHSMENEDSLLICDGCDKPFHMACCEPPILNIPKGK
ncbi:hypothetical protein K502DRAFT_294944 [Neoconidiobolus thromboides FSU 785]|nr:hypothetical protein K502DRAFT_294944 [Neoconidiobolus thromboides FSU 785]